MPMNFHTKDTWIPPPYFFHNVNVVGIEITFYQLMICKVIIHLSVFENIFSFL